MADDLEFVPVPDRGAEPLTPTRTYRTIIALFRPVAWWGRMRVEGADLIPESGPMVLVGNHDSQWDPPLIGRAVGLRRLVHTLAKSSLFKIPVVGRVLRGMRHIPIVRGAGDSGALVYAVAALHNGGAIGVFPEGTISRGETLRSRSGLGRLVLAAPETQIICCTIEGSTDFVRFPKRPRVAVKFFLPGTGQFKPGESPAELSQRLLDEIRERVPPVAAGRKRKLARLDAGGV